MAEKKLTTTGKGFSGSDDLAKVAEMLAAIASGNKSQGGVPFDPSTAETPKQLTQEEKAIEFFESMGDNLDAYPHKGIHVCDDAQRHVFHGNIQGENALANFISDTRDKSSNRPTVSYKSFAKPQGKEALAKMKNVLLSGASLSEDKEDKLPEDTDLDKDLGKGGDE